MKWSKVLPVVLMGVLVLTRVPGVLPQNFSAVYALMFCAGVYFPGRLAWWLPLVTLALSDLVLNLFCYPASSLGGLEMLALILPNYVAYAALILLGKWFTSRASWLSLLCGGFLGAVLFYFVTNTGAWLQNPEYVKTLGGWLQALTVGTPGYPHTWEFFRNTLLSGGLFSGLFAGAMKAVEAVEPEEEKEPEPAKEAEPEEA